MESKQKKILFWQPVSQIWAPRLYPKIKIKVQQASLITLGSQSYDKFSLIFNPTGSLKMHIVSQQGVATDKHIDDNENSKRTGMGNFLKKKHKTKSNKLARLYLPSTFQNCESLWENNSTTREQNKPKVRQQLLLYDI